MTENLAEIAPRVMAKKRSNLSHELLTESTEIIHQVVTAVAAADWSQVGRRVPKTGQGIFGLLSLRRSKRAGHLTLRADSLHLVKRMDRDLNKLLAECFPDICRGAVPRWIAAYDRDLERAKEFKDCWCWAACWVVLDFTEGRIGKANGGFKVFPLSTRDASEEG